MARTIKSRAAQAAPAASKVRKQCKACPWRKDVDPEKDIPNGYCEIAHERLGEIPQGFDSIVGPTRIMACHETPVGRELECVGWIAHALGPGNNIAIRMLARDKRYDHFELVGEQHEEFEHTLPRIQRSLHFRIAKALKWQLHSAVGVPLVMLKLWTRADGAASVSDEIQRLIDKGETHLGPLPGEEFQT